MMLFVHQLSDNDWWDLDDGKNPKHRIKQDKTGTPTIIQIDDNGVETYGFPL